MQTMRKTTHTHTQQVGVINFYCVPFNTQGVLTLQAFSSPIYIDFPTKQVWKNKKTNRQQQECQCQCQPCIPHWAACFRHGENCETTSYIHRRLQNSKNSGRLEGQKSTSIAAISHKGKVFNFNFHSFASHAVTHGQGTPVPLLTW